MKATFYLDKMGSLHVFKGNIYVETSSRCRPLTTSGKEADLFVQNQSDVEKIIVENLNERRINALMAGYPVHGELEDEYFEG